MEERQEKPLMLEEFNSNNTVQLTVAQVKEYLLKLSFVQEELKIGVLTKDKFYTNSIKMDKYMKCKIAMHSKIIA